MAFELAGHIDVEQVNLVVAGDLPAVRVEDEARRGHARFTRNLQRHGSGNEPQARGTRGVGQEGLDRAGARRLGNGKLVGLAAAHERKILRQRSDYRALLLRFAQQVARDRQIAGHVGGGGHLDRGDSGQGLLPWDDSLPVRALDSSPGGAEIRSTTGAAHGPLTW